MGSLNILGSSGHVAISWTNTSIGIDLAPPNEVKATNLEKEQVVKIIKEYASRGFQVAIDGKPFKPTVSNGTISVEDLNKAKLVHLEMPQEDITKMLSKVLNSKLVGNSLLFRIDKRGFGELIQKNEFILSGDYTTAKPLVGG